MKLIRKSTDLLKTAASAKAVWGLMKAYIGLGKRAKNQPIGDIETLRVFLQTRSSHVAQTSLYGYLRTRARNTLSRVVRKSPHAGVDQYREMANVAGVLV